MPEPARPLLVIPAATPTAARSPISFRGGQQARPKKARLAEKLEPRFAELQRSLESRAAQLALSPDSFSPEQVVIFETTALMAGKLIAALKATPTLAWLAAGELADLEPDDDFHFQDAKDKGKPLTARIFLVMANHVALTQLISLWKQWTAAKSVRLPDGYKAWGAAFGCLRDVRLWSAKDRIEEQGLREYWDECKAYKTTPLVEIEKRASRARWAHGRISSRQTAASALSIAQRARQVRTGGRRCDLRRVSDDATACVS